MASSKRMGSCLVSVTVFAVLFLAACKPVPWHVAMKVGMVWERIETMPASGGTSREVRIYGENVAGPQTKVYFNEVLCTARGYDTNENWVQVIAPEGPVGPVGIRVHNGSDTNPWSDPKDNLLAYTASQPVSDRFVLEGQVFPATLSDSHNVRGGNMIVEGSPLSDPQAPEVFAVVNPEEPLIIWNESTAGSFQFNPAVNGLGWGNKFEYGFARDGAFLDTSVPLDNIHDYLYISVAANDDADGDDFRRNRLFSIDYPNRTLSEVTSSVPTTPYPMEDQSLDTHRSSTVITSRNLDQDGNLYIIIAGGSYPNKQTMSGIATGTLEILRVDIDAGGQIEKMVRVPAVNIPMPEAVMTDVDVINADNVGPDDLLVTVWSDAAGRYTQILTNNTLSTDPYPSFVSSGLLPQNETQGKGILGAAVADLDQTGRDEFILFSCAYDNHCQGKAKDITAYKYSSVSGTFESNGTITWSTDRAAWYKRSYDGVPIVRTGRVEYIAVSGSVPYLLINDTTQGQDIALREFREELDHSQDYKGGPLFSEYSALGVYAGDIDNDGLENEVIFSGQVEQCRLWRLSFDEQDTLIDVQDETDTALVADGDLSGRMLGYDLVGDHDIAVAVNLVFSPTIYGIDRDNGEIYDWSYEKWDWGANPLYRGGYDGVLENFDGIEGPELVIAAGRGGGPSANWLYSWHAGQQKFLYHEGALPADAHITRGVDAADVDGVSGLDLVFANTDANLDLALNNGSGSFTYSSIQQSSGYHSVSFIEYPPPTLPDLIAGSLNKIDIYTNLGGSFALTGSVPLWQNGAPVPPDVLFYVVEFIVPINLETPYPTERPDFFVCTQNGRNLLLKRTAPRTFQNVSENISGLRADTWGAAVGDLNADGYDDITTCNFPDGIPVYERQVYFNRGASGAGIFDDVTAEVFSKELNHDGYEGEFNRDGGLNALIVESFNDLQKPAILTANDGQNRLYVHTTP